MRNILGTIMISGSYKCIHVSKTNTFETSDK